MIVRILAEAEDELYAAAQWYEDRDAGVGQRLLSAFDLSRGLIEQRASHFPLLETVDSERGIRRCFLRHFPYMIVFELRGDEVMILAVAHTSRGPNYWSERAD